MSRVIDPERIEAGDLDEDEIQYLQDRNRLPENYFEEEEEEQSTPSIGTSGGIVDDEDESEEEDYDEGWNNKQRRAELQRRGLSIEGNKDELIGRLRRSDHEELESDDYSELED